jgi:7,8-dihydroneopterin aldolase/epimerase/oxygenase
MATLFIEQLAIQTTIGVLAFEKHIKQTLLLDLEFDIDITQASHSDQLTDTVDYAAIAKMIQRFTTEVHFELIEALATAIIEKITTTFNIRWLRLRLTKPYAAAQAKAVGIIVEYGERL